MKIINKDLLSVDKGIICHQVNCQKKMGAGLALSIKKKWPCVFKEYAKKEEWLLGDCQFVKINDNLYVANLAGQFFYGTDRQYTDYWALRKAISEADNFHVEKSLPIYFPYKIGCNLAGGDWEIVSKIIDEECPEAIICQK